MSSVVDRLGEKGKTYSVWMGLSCSPEHYFQPATYDDVKQIVQAAGASGETVRVVGWGYSLNPQSLTSGYLVDLQKLNKVLKVDKESCQIKVEAGATIKELDEQILPEQGLGLSIHPTIKSLTVGGYCSTGVISSGHLYSTASNYIVAMEMMLASGVIIEISETMNADLFPAARLSLGVLGIILNVTLQCEPEFRLHQRHYGTSTTTMMESLESMTEYSDHFRFNIPSENNFEQAIVEHVSRKEEFQVVKSLPFEDSALLQEKSDRSDNIFAPTQDRNWSDIMYIMMWAVKRDKAKDVTVELIECVNALNPGPSCVIGKFIRQDDLYISPAYNQDSFYVEVLTFNSPGSTVDKLALKSRMYAALSTIMARYGGRPHWAQYYDLPSVDYSKLYPKWQTFLDIRQRLDPAGTFLNTELESVFLP